MSGHLDDLLSAHVDGELTPQEQAVVNAHVGVCAACRAELTATERAKRWLTGLPEVQPPFGFYERMLLDGSGPRSKQGRWSVRVGAVSLAATASIWFGVIGLAGVNGSRPGGMPPLSSFVNLHLHASTPKQEKAAAPAIEQEAVRRGLPSELSGGFHLYRLAEQGEETWALYTDYRQVISVFVEPAVIDPAELPGGSSLQRFDDQVVWLVPTEAGQAVMAQRGDNVVVVMGELVGGTSVAEEVHPPTIGDSILDHVDAAGRGLFEAFGLG